LIRRKVYPFDAPAVVIVLTTAPPLIRIQQPLVTIGTNLLLEPLAERDNFHEQISVSL
jgi:hypothetical protein